MTRHEPIHSANREKATPPRVHFDCCPVTGVAIHGGKRRYRQVSTPARSVNSLSEVSSCRLGTAPPSVGRFPEGGENDDC